MNTEDLQELIDKAEMHKLNNELSEAIKLWRLVLDLHPNTDQGKYAAEQLKKHQLSNKDKKNSKSSGGIGSILLIIFGLYIASQIGGYLGKGAAENASSNRELSKELQAAQFYEAYYLSRTRGAYNFCKIHGIDITEYVKSYKDVEAETYNRASKILETNGHVFGADYDKHSDLILRTLEKEMQKTRDVLAKQLNDQSVNLSHVCKLFAVAGKESLINYSFAMEKPKLYRDLMNFGTDKKDTTSSKDGSFQIVNFNNEIQISVPRNWDYLDASMKKHLQTGSDAMIRTSGLPHDSSENTILIAANAHTSNKSTIATLRLSVRNVDAPSQSDMYKFSKLSKDEISRELAPVLKSTQQKIDSYFKGMSKTKESNISIVNNKSILCILVNTESTRSDGDWLTQVYMCPLSTKSVKVTTSYRISNELLMKPVVQYVWQSLIIK